MRSVFFAPALIIAAMLSAAEACPPPPPPPPPAAGETIEAYQARLEEEARAQVSAYQRQWWNEAHSVLLARVVSVDSIRLRDDWGAAYARSPRVHLRPVRWLKGSGPWRRFRLNYQGLTDCGPYGGGEAVTGRVGELFVVFVRAGAPAQANVITSLAPDHIVDSELRSRVLPPDDN
jgi:hypothetical protein